MKRSDGKKPQHPGQHRSRIFERLPKLFRSRATQGNAVSPPASPTSRHNGHAQTSSSRSASRPHHRLLHTINKGREKVELTLVDEGFTEDNVFDSLDDDDELRVIFFLHFGTLDRTLESDFSMVPHIVHLQVDDLLTLGGCASVQNLWGGKWLVCCDGPGNAFIYTAFIILFMHVAKFDIARSVRELIMLEKGRLSQVSKFRGRDLRKPLHDLYRDSDELRDFHLEIPVKLKKIVQAEAQLVSSRREGSHQTRLDRYEIETELPGGRRKERKLKDIKDEAKLWQGIVECVERDKQPWDDSWSNMETQADWDKRFGKFECD